MAKSKPPQPRTLREERERQLSRPPEEWRVLSQQKGNNDTLMWWAALPNDEGDLHASTPWEPYIKHCFHLMSRNAGQKLSKTGDKDVPTIVYALAFPVPFQLDMTATDVGADREVMPSGIDNYLSLTDEGDDLSCAERKILLGMIGSRQLYYNDIWLFYTTHSPCRLCLDVMLANLRRSPDSETGYYRHLIIVFEGVYGSPELAPYPTGSLQHWYRDRFLPNRPGVEIFKIFHERPKSIPYSNRDFNVGGGYTLEDWDESQRMQEDHLLYPMRVEPVTTLH